MASAQSDAEKEDTLNGLLQKLVDLKNWKVKTFPAQEIGDIINAVSERIGKWKDLGERLVLYLRTLQVITANTQMEASKIKDFKVCPTLT